MLLTTGAFAADCYTPGFACTNLDTQIKGSRPPYFGIDSGAANAYVVTTVAPLGPGLRNGTKIEFVATHANTTVSTMNVDGTGVKTIKKWSSGTLSDVASGDISNGQVISVTYDGTYFQMLGGAGGTSSGASIQVNTSAITGTTANFSDTTPAPPTGAFNVKYQKDTNSPTTNISSYVDEKFNRTTCIIVIGADNASSTITNADLGPQTNLCPVMTASTLVEFGIAVDNASSTTSIQVRKRHCSTFTSGGCTAFTTTNLLSGALAARSTAFAIACARSTTSATCYDGTTSSGTITISTTAIAQGDWLEFTSGTADGTTKRISVYFTWTKDN